MAFLTPCFVRVEDPAEREKLIKWLKKIGWVFIGPYSKRRKYLLCKPTDKTVTAWVMNERYAESLENIGYVFCGTNVDLFRALAAMNDDNCLEQWFTDGQNWGICKDKYWAVQVAKWDVEGNDDMLEMAINPQCHKATAEEIVEYFKKREK